MKGKGPSRDDIKYYLKGKSDKKVASILGVDIRSARRFMLAMDNGDNLEDYLVDRMRLQFMALDIVNRGTLREVADTLGISRQAVHLWYEQGICYTRVLQILEKCSADES